MYFKEFPTIPYDAEGNGKFKDVKNLLRRVGIRAKVKANTSLYDTYDVKNGETPESIAHKLYGDSELHWVILLLNDVTDRFHDWPMSEAQFIKFVNDKYDNVDAIHHYEIPQSSGDTSITIQVPQGTDGATPITNLTYEMELNESKRSIDLLRNEYLTFFIDEFEEMM